MLYRQQYEMKSSILVYALLSSAYAAPVLSQLVLPNFFKQRGASVKSASGQQLPIMNAPNIALPPSNSGDEPSGGAGDVRISDVIGKERVINIFAGFTRDIENISRRLDDTAQNTTVIAPLNSEIQKLPRKPWEDPRDYDTLGATAYDGPEGEDRAHRNMRRFVEAHIIPVSPWKEGDKVESIGGGKVWWENKEGKKMASNTFWYEFPAKLIEDQVQPGDIEVSSVASRVSNGELWIVKGVLNYA